MNELRTNVRGTVLAEDLLHAKKPKPRQYAYAIRKGATGGTALLSLLAMARVAQAQEQVLAPQPIYSVAPPAMQEYEASQAGALPVEQLASSVIPTPSWLQWGPVNVHPHLVYRVLYGSGILSEPGQTQTTAVQEFSPGLLFVLGKHWTLDYTPQFDVYSSSSFQNSTTETVSLNWGTVYQDWVLGFSQGYTSSSVPLVQTAMQTDTQNFVTSAHASYLFTSKMSMDMSISQNFSSAEGFTSSRIWSTMYWLNYKRGENWDIGLGVGYEYDEVNPGPNAMSENAQGRIRWRATDKTSFVLHGGAVDQQYLGSGAAGNLITPVFGASVAYQPVETTTLSLTADRSLTPSLFQGQVTENTSVGFNVNQRLLKRFNLSAGAAYGRTSYLATTNTATPGTGRLDNYYSFNVRLGTRFLTRGTAAVFYQFSDNPSTQPGFSFTSSQVGLEIGYHY